MALKIALVQMEQMEDPTTYDKRKQVQHAADLIRGAPAADLYVLPELAPTGYLAHLGTWLMEGYMTQKTSKNSG